MLTRIRRALPDREEGFTLIELLVVMIIIGILAAIAIPVFLNQRQSGYDAAAKSDAHNAALAEESNFTDNQAYIAANSSGVIGGFTKSSNTTSLKVTSYTGTTFQTLGTVSGTDASFKVYAVSKSGKLFCYDSGNSGKGVYPGATGTVVVASC